MTTLHNVPIKAKSVCQKETLDTQVSGRLNRQPQTLLQLIFDALNMPMALLDGCGQIIVVNIAWKKISRIYGNRVPPGRIGTNFRDLCKETIGKGFSPESWNELDQVFDGKQQYFEGALRFGKRNVSGDFRVRVTGLGSAPLQVMVTLEEISQLARARDSAGELGQRVLEIQAEERQRFATELHDTVGQYFVSLELLLSRLRMEADGSEPAAAVVREMSDVLKEAQAEIRTLSFLLSPPWVEYERGLERAIRGFVQGFAKRAELKADIHIHGSPFRLDQSRQVTLFRIVQEALVNIYRHANADVVVVNLINRGENVTLQVIDNGAGLLGGKAGKFAPGAGLAGMRARMKHLGGELHIGTGLTGTTLTATLPIN